MFFKSKFSAAKPSRSQRKAIKKAAALSPDSQSLAAVYALGIRDGLQIAADIRKNTVSMQEDRS